MGGLFSGIAIVLLVQWYVNQKSNTDKSTISKEESNRKLANSRPSGWLIITKGPEQGRSILLDQPVMRIGRDPTNEIRIEHPQVSRFHARFTWENAKVFLEDQGSTNGSYVNHIRVKQRQMLNNGDLIDLGKSVMLTFYQ